MAEPSAGRPLKVAMLGASPRALCGVRDHAAILALALEHEVVHCTTYWLTREPESLMASRSRMRSWTESVRMGIDRSGAEAVLLHYSVFSFSYKGLPLMTHELLATLRRTDVPLLSLLHEYAYPWGRDGVAGLAWAVTQRAALIEIVRASTALAVTTESRANWLRTRPWLAQRPVVVTPVFSNLPPAADGTPPRNPVPVIGIFGYTYGAAVSELVCVALRRLEDEGRGAQLLLIGSPGRSSPVGEEWIGHARAAGLDAEPAFTGRLELEELANAIAACDVVLNADPSGPSSRKTTLAAALASGRPVLAFDGPGRWGKLAEMGGVLLVERDEQALADALGRLIEDEAGRQKLGARGLSFAAENMTPAKSAATLARSLRGMLGG